VFNALEGGLDLGRQGRELSVHDHQAVIARRNADVSARTFQHVDAIGDLLRFDLDLAQVLVLGKSKCRAREKGAQKELSHISPRNQQSEMLRRGDANYKFKITNYTSEVTSQKLVAAPSNSFHSWLRVTR